MKCFRFGPSSRIRIVKPTANSIPKSHKYRADLDLVSNFCDAIALSYDRVTACLVLTYGSQIEVSY